MECTSRYEFEEAFDRKRSLRPRWHPNRRKWWAIPLGVRPVMVADEANIFRNSNPASVQRIGESLGGEEACGGDRGRTIRSRELVDNRSHVVPFKVAVPDVLFGDGDASRFKRFQKCLTTENGNVALRLDADESNLRVPKSAK